MGTCYIAVSDARKEVMLLSKSVVLYYAVASDSGTDPVGYKEYTNDSLRNLIDRCVASGLYNPDEDDPEWIGKEILDRWDLERLRKIQEFQPDRLISEHHPAYFEFDSPDDDGYIGDYKVTASLYPEQDAEYIGKTWDYYMEH